jgi:succinoglycan biosynthesis protein ExoA
MPAIKESVSIIIPTFNEASNIGQCLEAIQKSDYPLSDIEIIIIDGGSGDKTVEVINRFKKSGLLITLIDAPGTTVYKALNIGLQNAKGEYIVRVDARSIIPSDYISSCIKNIKEKRASVAGGVQRQFGINIYQNTIAEALQSSFGTGNAKFRTGNFSGYVDTVYLGVFKRQTFEEVGVYDDDGIVISEDAMMNARIKEKGGKIYLDGNLIVMYPAKNNLKELSRQYFIYGGAKAHTFKKYKKLTAARQYIVLITFILGIAVGLLSLSGVISIFFLIVPTVLYMLITLVNACIIKLRQGKRVSFFYNLFVYPAIHFSWAAGFFCRLIFGKKYADFFFKTKSKSR